MKIAAVLMIVFASVATGGLARAGADDAKWIAQCQKDNEEAKVSKDVVTKYCACMNDKMGENETRSITEWEKANPNTRAACEKAAGWN